VPAELEQLPLAQVPETPLPVQASPAPTQARAPAMPGRQHPPPLQLLPLQHGWPEAPHAAVPPPLPPEPAARPPLPLAPPPPPFDLLLLHAATSKATITAAARTATIDCRIMGRTSREWDAERSAIPF
jgi:hypothetical protein